MFSFSLYRDVIDANSGLLKILSFARGLLLLINQQTTTSWLSNCAVSMFWKRSNLWYYLFSISSKATIFDDLFIKHRTVQQSFRYTFLQESNRPHTTVKNARNLKSVSKAKPPNFEGIFKFWRHEQQIGRASCRERV